MNTTLCALACLPLFASATLPAGPVRRVTLFGYELAGEVLDLDEAARRAEASALSSADVAPPCPPPAATIAEIEELHRQIEQDLAALKAGQPATFLGMPLEIVNCDALPEPVPARVVVLDELAPTDVDPVDQAGTPAYVAPERDAAGDEDVHACAAALAEPDLEEDLMEPALGRAVLCPPCNGGTRHVRAGCPRCDGRFVRVFVENHEYKLTPPDTEAGRLGMAYALADLLPELPERAVKGALELLDVALKGADTSTRERGLAQWKFMRDRQAVA